MTTTKHSPEQSLRDAVPAQGFGLLYAIRTARAWWYSAWLRTLARFSRTYFGSFWLGLSNLLSVLLLSVVYGAVFKVEDPYGYAIYLGIGLTVWGLIGQSITSGCSLFGSRRDQLINNSMPAIFYCLEEWAFQVQTFAQAFIVILAATAIVRPAILFNCVVSLWLPLANLYVFSLWAIMLMSVLGSRFKDLGQLVPIVLQLVFLISPILYRKESLGEVGVFAQANPLYRILAPVRDAVINGRIHLSSEIVVLFLNLCVVILMAAWLKRLRHKLPLWV